MARGSTLEAIRNDFRAECRLSMNAAHNTQDAARQIIVLQRTQEWLWRDFDWPHLRVDRFIDLQAGQRYYDMPEDLDIDRIQRVAVRHDRVYCDLRAGIDEAQYAAHDSDLDQRAWPVRRWQLTEDEMLEVWPVPSLNFQASSLDGRLKITGIRRLKPFVAESDRADLDDRLIVLFAAAEYLASKNSDDAQLKLDQATQLYSKLRGQLMHPRRYAMFGTGQPSRIKRVPIAIYNKG